ncbi:MAG: hypothetical protein C5B59_12835 [Bacteroidetes bacterium]|nr:MAG: hypothetical protein C5B59_12835 [Bacteroidota bacterium]
MISVITPSVRHEGLALVERALGRQTHPFEWLVVSPKKPSNLGCRWIQDPPKEEGDYWTLNKGMNKAIKESNGELIVSWQDYTYAKPDCLEKFWFHYQENPKLLVSAVGDKYTDDTWTVKTWQDPRERDDQGSFYLCYPQDIEFNLCAVPKAAFYAVGGYDEYLDKFAGMDGFSVTDRLLMIAEGWNFALDQTNKSFSLEHGRLPDWDARNAIHEEYKKREVEYLENPRLPYLK